MRYINTLPLPLPLPDNSRHHVWTCSDIMSGSSNELFYSAGRTNFIYQLWVEVSPVTMPPKEQSNYFSRLCQSKVVSILKKKLQWMKGKFSNILVSPNPLKAQWLHWISTCIHLQDYRACWWHKQIPFLKLWEYFFCILFPPLSV